MCRPVEIRFYSACFPGSPRRLIPAASKEAQKSPPTAGGGEAGEISHSPENFAFGQSSIATLFRATSF